MNNNRSVDNSVVNEDPISRLGLSLTLLLFGAFLASLLLHSSTIAIPAIARELALSANLVSWFPLAQVLTSACFILPAGKLSDRFGRRKMFSMGLAVCCVACFIGGFAVNGGMMLLARGLQGMGGTLIFAAAVALMVSVPPQDQKVKIMGIFLSVAYIGAVSGPLFGGVIVQYVDWRWVFWVPAILFLLLTIAGFAFLHWERYGDRETRIRILDVSLYIAALMLIAFGVFDAVTIQGQMLLVLGVISFSAFCWFQSKRRDPLLQVKLFTQNRIFTILGFAHFLAYAGILALPFTLTLYLQFIKGVDAQTTGFVLLTQALCTSLVSPCAGWLSLRFQPRQLILTGTTLFVIGVILLASLDAFSTVWFVSLGIALIGVGVGIMDAPIIHTSMATVSDDLVGSASATLNGLRTMGGFVGVAVISYLMGIHLNNAPIEPENLGELMLVVQQFLMICLVFACLSLCLLIYGVLTRPR